MFFIFPSIWDGWLRKISRQPGQHWCPKPPRLDPAELERMTSRTFSTEEWDHLFAAVPSRGSWRPPIFEDLWLIWAVADHVGEIAKNKTQLKRSNMVQLKIHAALVARSGLRLPGPVLPPLDVGTERAMASHPDIPSPGKFRRSGGTGL